MKIEHIALYVRDLKKMKSFYETYFGAVSGERYHNPKTGLSTYFLSFSDNTRIEIMHRPDMTETERGLMETGYIHLAFSAGSRESVDRLTDKLRDDGYTVLSNPRITGDGYYESCILDPEGNQIEIVA
ncbi:VOC family protein [Anaerotignum sp.]